MAFCATPGSAHRSLSLQSLRVPSAQRFRAFTRAVNPCLTYPLPAAPRTFTGIHAALSQAPMFPNFWGARVHDPAGRGLRRFIGQ